ncbi:hypothetical protein HGI30_06665 [Paenibacillus albicereus]|uniref:ParA family protein n=1 Tax=Paenibacillus albicereus TaxID=2726185 RepID=A0A6H2GVT6_9BACL|nr:hypothetical protein [Paenibacillus albicereus]QJC51258.1 hypothetical protein HGI30_06665 [Paenibacillus albicereus]
MARLEIVVAAAESEYMRRLAAGVRDSPFGSRWRLTACTTGDSLRQYLKGGYAVHLVLAQPSLLEQAGELPAGIPAAAFVRRRGEGGGLPELLQYQPVPELLAGIEALLAGSGDKRLRAGGEGAAVVAVCDPVGGAGKSTCSLWLARLAGERGLRALYLNLERFDASGLQLREPGEASGEGVEALLYALKADKPDFPARLTSVRRYSRRMGTDYIGEAPSPEERQAMTGDDAARLLEALAGSGLYDLIVADMDSVLDDAAAAVLERCDAVVWLAEPSAVARRKTRLAFEAARLTHPAAAAAARSRMLFVRSRVRPHAEEDRVAECAADRSLPAFAAELPYDPGIGRIESAAPAYIQAAGDLLDRLGCGTKRSVGL